MHFKITCLSAFVLALSAFSYMQSASATPLLCEDVTVNHMYVDTSQVSSCLGPTRIGHGSFTQTGTFSLNASPWFGTGNKPDAWFVYLLNPMIATGGWEFINVFGRGGGLSHLQLYGREPTNSVPEPGTLALLGVGLLGAAAARRRKRA